MTVSKIRRRAVKNYTRRKKIEMAFMIAGPTSSRRYIFYIQDLDRTQASCQVPEDEQLSSRRSPE